MQLQFQSSLNSDYVEVSGHQAAVALLPGEESLESIQ